MSAPVTDPRGLSFWWRSLPGPVTPRAPLPGDRDADVVVVGAGYTGLWTAYYLLKADPTLRVVVLEKELAGYGASGRNGGWCSALFPASMAAIAARSSREGAVAMMAAMRDSVDAVGLTATAEGIDCGFEKGGTLAVATNAAQERRLRRGVADLHRWGLGPEDVRWLDRGEADDVITTAGSRGGVFTPHCAAIQPARLARGLARAVERLGVRIHEGTPVRSFHDGVVETDAGRVRADVVVRATEAFTAQLPGLARAIVPLYTLMIATEPLGEGFWKEVGWDGRATFADGRRMIIYAQRTDDDRIAFGGRGAPYHFGSRVHPAFDRDPATFALLEETLVSLFPGARDALITNRWGGPVGTPRDWFASVGLDRAAKAAWAGGYVGDGVSTTNLAGRTLADLILERDTDLIRLPWVGHQSPRWEPEPLRWLAIRGLARMTSSADAHEQRTGREARLRGRILDAALGH